MGLAGRTPNQQPNLLRTAELVVGHPGWGELLAVKDLLPGVPSHAQHPGSRPPPQTCRAVGPFVVPGCALRAMPPTVRL